MENGAELLRALSEEPAQQTDLELITEMALRAEKAAAAFRIQHHEDLVVTFGVSTGTENMINDFDIGTVLY
jgi:hypothetical protein